LSSGFGAFSEVFLGLLLLGKLAFFPLLLRGKLAFFPLLLLGKLAFFPLLILGKLAFFSSVDTRKISIFSSVDTRKISIFSSVDTRKISIFSSVDTRKISIFSSVDTRKISIFSSVDTRKISIFSSVDKWGLSIPATLIDFSPRWHESCLPQESAAISIGYQSGSRQTALPLDRYTTTRQTRAITAYSAAPPHNMPLSLAMFTNKFSGKAVCKGHAIRHDAMRYGMILAYTAKCRISLLILTV
jgi:hypothetical protein